MTPQTNRLHHPSVQNARVDAFSANVQGTNYLRQVDIPALDYQYQPHSTVPASEAGFRSQDEAVVPSMNIQYQANMGLAQNQPNLVHPTAAIAPMRPFPDDDQQLPRQQEGRADELTMSSGMHKDLWKVPLCVCFGFAFLPYRRSVIGEKTSAHHFLRRLEVKV